MLSKNRQRQREAAAEPTFTAHNSNEETAMGAALRQAGLGS